MIPVFFLVSIIVFSMLHLIPGNPLDLIVNPRMGTEAIQKVERKLGLDRPLYTQYLLFMKKILTGDLGYSFYTHMKISTLIIERLSNTVILTLTGLLLSSLCAIPLGIMAATHQGGPLDYASMSFALVGIAMPQFWLGLLLILIFSVKLGWFPVAGYGDLRHLVLPATALGVGFAAVLARVLRSSMLEFLSKDFITTARAKGLSERVVVNKHALKPALTPIIALFGLHVGWLIGGAVVIEAVFNRPGIGRLMLNSIYARDYPTVQVLTLMIASCVMLGNLAADILLSLVNPKIRYN